MICCNGCKIWDMRYVETCEVVGEIARMVIMSKF
jgi:hypothetical protein